MLGYKYNNGRLVIVPREAETIQRIYEEYLSGKGYYRIAKDLNTEGILPKSGLLWKTSVIAKILKNYNYTGNLLLQKTYRENHITKKCKLNRGELPQYLAQDTHNAIIDMDTFNAVQAEMAHRAERFTHDEKASVVFPLTGKIRCGHCGKNFNRKTVRGQKVWICSTYNKRGKDYCHMKQIPEDILCGVITDTVASLDGVDCILADENNLLTIYKYDGTKICTAWQDRSRSKSWTDEMKEAARQKNNERIKSNG